MIGTGKYLVPFFALYVNHITNLKSCVTLIICNDINFECSFILLNKLQRSQNEKLYSKY